MSDTTAAVLQVGLLIVFTSSRQPPVRDGPAPRCPMRVTSGVLAPSRLTSRGQRWLTAEVMPGSVEAAICR